MDSQDVVYIFEKIFAGYHVVLFLATVILNPIILVTCLKRKKLRSTSTFKMMAFGSINDLLSCLIWNLEDIYVTFFDFRPYFVSLLYCRWISVFLQFATLQYASWSLVSISLDRFLSLTVKKWSKHYFNHNRPFVYCCVLALLIAAINVNEGFTTGYNYFENGTEITVCFDNSPNDFHWYQTMSQILLYFGYIVPYGLIILFNGLIIYKANRFERVHNQTSSMNSSSFSNATSSKRKAEMTRTILIITFLYIVTSILSTVITGYFYFDILSLKCGQMIINLADSLLFSFPSLNFFILFFSNKLFAREFKCLLGLNVEMTNYSTRTNHSTNLHHQN